MNSKTLGIDISKTKFDVALLEGERIRHCAFSNDAKGFRGLWSWLERHNAAQIHACLEATSVYGLELAKYLYERRAKVSIVNPACVRAFANSELRRSKTDRMDAALIARFCRAMNPRGWEPPAPEVAQLQALVRRLEDLKAMKTQEANRREVSGQPAPVEASLQQLQQVLQAEIRQIEKAISEHCSRHPALKAKVEQLTSIPGIGLVTAALLISEIVDVNRYENARQLAAYAGLVPSERTSGTSVRGKPRLSKRGNVRLRTALYWPAIVAMKHNPTLCLFAQRLLRKGKEKKVVIIAVMRKLLQIAFGVLKSSTLFNPNHAPKTTSLA